MISKKQPLTREALLSFKASHGDFYEKFINIMKEKVHFYRNVKDHKQCPPYMLAQKCIFMSILQRKNQKFQNQQLDITQIANIFRQYRPHILKSIKIQKNIIFKKLKDFQIENIQHQIIELMTRSQFSFNTFQLPHNTYIYQLFKAICDRSEAVSFLGQPKYQPMTYSYIQIKKISSIFNENIMLFDYDTSKSSANKIQFNPQTTYILKIKDKYYILYVATPKYFQIIEEGTINLKEIESIFSKDSPQKLSDQNGFLNKIVNGFQGSKPQALQSKLFPKVVECCKCFKKLSEFDCLKWNYEQYCSKCLESPYLDTSNIPSTLIEKFFLTKGIKHYNYPLTCAQCTVTTSILNYNPAQKPHKYKCSTCQYTICLQHNMNINQCYCECLQCKSRPTVNIVHLNLNLCEYCKKKYCLTCQKFTTEFCDCICQICYSLKDKNHICEQRCHYCRNHINCMKRCVCSRKICYGCYYFQLKNYGGKQQKFICSKLSS